MILFPGLFLLLVGGIGGYQLANFPKVKELQQNRAIQEHFDLKANEYTYFIEDTNEGAYILSCEDQEFRIKFSDNKPMKVVYAEAVMVPDETS